MKSEPTTIHAVHSRGYADAIARMLEAHNIGHKLESDASGNLVTVFVEPDRLREAVAVVESGPAPVEAERVRMNSNGRNILVPVDFSDYSMLAVKAAFEFAKRLDMHPLILNTFVAPVLPAQPSFDDSPDDTLFEQEAGMEMRRISQKRMEKFKNEVLLLQKEGELTDIGFSTETAMGLPEEVIKEYSKITPPGLIVMATRGKNRREADMMGSVTAEVLDSCRVPVFTVPENISFVGVENITRLVFFCNLDRSDAASVDSLMTMFDCPVVDVTLVPVSEGTDATLRHRMETFCSMLTAKYPLASFSIELLGKKDFREQFQQLVDRRQIQLLIVPNKKSNIFSRLFKPGIAHRMLFERDMPMLALPV